MRDIIIQSRRFYTLSMIIENYPKKKSPDNVLFREPKAI
jgi:hypothetical protein